MNRRWSRSFLFIGTMTLIAYTPSAEPAHDLKGEDKDGLHEPSPQPPKEEEGGTCAAAGIIVFDNANGNGGIPPAGGVSGEKNHNHFQFGSVAFSCDGGAGTAFEGPFAIDAAGGTDGPGECDPNNIGKDPNCDLPGNDTHGEDTSAGWSHGSCYDDLVDGSNGITDHDCDDMKKVGKHLSDIYNGVNTNPRTGDFRNMNEIVAEDVFDPAARHSCATNWGPGGFPKNSGKDCDNWLKFCRGVYNDDIEHDGVDDRLPVALGGHGGSTCSNLGQGGTHVSTGGGHILAWGALTDWSHVPPDIALCFLASLHVADARSNESSAPLAKISELSVIGSATTWVVIDKDDCHGKKKP